MTYDKVSWAGLTWDLPMTWLASSWMGKLMPSSEEKESMGERVPEVSTMLRTESLRSEKAFRIARTQIQTQIFNTAYSWLCSFL